MARIIFEIDDKELSNVLNTLTRFYEKDRADALLKYAYMKDDGYISEDEYAKKKGELMRE